MKIFISYARVDKPVCTQLVNTLGAHEVWYDQRLYAGQHWWKEILRRLEWCDVFIYLLSKDSIASKYCRKELVIAKKFGREIIPVLIDANAIVPANLESVQYIDMCNQFDAENVSVLHNSLWAIQEQLTKQGVIKQKVEKLSTSELESPVNISADIVSQGAQALEEGRNDEAVLLFKQAQAKGLHNKFINIEKMLAAAEKAVAEQTARLEKERNYAEIRELFQFESVREFACEAFSNFQKVYPDYDPDGLASYCEARKIPAAPKEKDIPDDLLPMLKWCKIPGGITHVANLGVESGQMDDDSVRLKSFWMSKYPVTNLQFQKFIDDENGYSNPFWWQFSDHSITWFEEHPEALPPRYEGDDRPRENVNWYEAMAFAQWLSHKTGYNITLPLVAQWQRASQGDDDRFFPWGNVFSDDRCNTYESQIRMTTSVTAYDKGVSPYGVYDMSGNVWEWCLDKAEPEQGSYDYRRAVIGGSFVSPANRAQSSFRYFLKSEVRYSSIGIRLVCLSHSNNLGS